MHCAPTFAPTPAPATIKFCIVFVTIAEETSGVGMLGRAIFEANILFKLGYISHGPDRLERH